MFRTTLVDAFPNKESQRLRTFCSSETWSPSDLDEFAGLLQTGAIAEVRADFQSRVKKSEAAKARQDLAAIQYSSTVPTRSRCSIPSSNSQSSIFDPSSRLRYLQIARYLALEAEVSVDTTDLSGATTFMCSISTKPYWEEEFAEIMLQGGAQVSTRNRYGCTATHDIVMARDLSAEGKMRTIDALTFFVAKDGDLDIKDGDGVSARTIGKSVIRFNPELGILVNPTAARSNMTGAGTGTGSAAGAKIGRNDPCRCGSKPKYKVCCGKN